MADQPVEYSKHRTDLCDPFANHRIDLLSKPQCLARETRAHQYTKNQPMGLEAQLQKMEEANRAIAKIPESVRTATLKRQFSAAIFPVVGVGSAEHYYPQ